MITRFAPSPTGSFHAGGARTALYNYLLAKKTDGVFLLRIEDTDRTRYKDYAVSELVRALKWLGITWDLGPTVDEFIELGVDRELAEAVGSKKSYAGMFVQSKRKSVYGTFADKLIAGNMAYRVFSSGLNEENVGGVREKGKNYARLGQEMNLDKWRNASSFISRKALNTGRPYHVRLKLPRQGTIMCSDLIRGDLEFRWNVLFDPVILKSDGMPTYHFAAAIDDKLHNIYDNGIVIRNEEWLSSLPIHTYLAQVLWNQTPKFCHTASILNPVGKGKMSKRFSDEMKAKGVDIPVFVNEYAERGFIPEAFNNFAALVGWNPKNGKEIMSMDDMITEFNLEGLNDSASRWDLNKLKYFNREWIKRLDGKILVDRVMEAL